MAARTVQGTSHVLSFCSSLGFRRDAVMTLDQRGAFAALAAHPNGRPALPREAVEVDGVQLRVGSRPFSETATHDSIWSYLDDDAKDRWPALPYRLVVRLPLSPGEIPFPGPWPRALACECLISGLGLGVKMRFAFGGAPRDTLVRWPGNSTRLALRGPGGKTLWTGTVSDGAVLAARAALASLGDAWSNLAQDGWEKVLGRGVRRIWAEIADLTEAGHKPPDKRLLYGLATQNPGWHSISRTELHRREFYRVWNSRARKVGEAQFFGPTGAALYLRYTPGNENPEWRSANCHRRDIVYGLAQHNLLVDQLRTLVREVGDGSTVETVGVTGNARVRDMARLRLALLNDLLQRYPWVRHYTRLQLKPEDLEKLPGAIKSSLSPELLAKVSAHLDPSTEPSESEPEGETEAGANDS